MANKNNETIIVHEDDVTYGDPKGDADRAAAVEKVDADEKAAEEGCGYYITEAGHDYLEQQKNK